MKWVKKTMEQHYIKDQVELAELCKLITKIINPDDSVLQRASKLSEYCKQTIDFPIEMPEDRAWYEASAHESLTKWKIGNCLNYAKSLIGLAYAAGINGRCIWINGKVDGYDEVQGHTLCELEIDGQWMLFDAMYGVPFLNKLDAKTPSAYECWKDPMQYVEAINPKYYGFTEKFWRQLWFDFRVIGNKGIRDMSEPLFVEIWYDENPYVSNTNLDEKWWYTEFREKVKDATDEEVPPLYEILYKNYLYAEKGHHPHESVTILKHTEDKLEMTDIPNTYRFVRVLIKQFMDKAKILELGCGASSFPFILAIDGYNVTAIDMRRGVIDNLRNVALLLPEDARQRLRFKCTLAEKLPYLDNGFDIIVGVDFLEHIRNLDHLLKECDRVLKRGGRMYFTTPISGIGWSPEHLHSFICEDDLKRIFNSCGFNIRVYYERYRWEFLDPNIFIIEATRG